MVDTIPLSICALNIRDRVIGGGCAEHPLLLASKSRKRTRTTKGASNYNGLVEAFSLRRSDQVLDGKLLMSAAKHLKARWGARPLTTFA
jgi:hypothetical protein